MIAVILISMAAITGILYACLVVASEYDERAGYDDIFRSDDSKPDEPE